MSYASVTSLRLATLDSVSANISISESSTTRRLEFTAWISTAACEYTIQRKAFPPLILDRTRPGERVARRRRCKTSIGASHKIKRDETVKWFKNRFEGIVR
jgi:hypothetical protein